MAANFQSSSVLPMASTDSPPKLEEKLFKGSAMTKRGAYAAISYMTCAVLLVLFNKAALSSYSFPSANVITLCQMICSCCFLYVLRRSKLISFSANESIAVAESYKTLVPIKTLIDTSPLALTYLLYMCGNNSARCFIAGARDLSFDTYGYLVVFLANITTAIYLATIARVGKTSGLNSFGLMWCNGIICGPVLLLWTLFRGDLEMTMNFPYLLSPGFLVVLALSCILAFFLNYSIFLNTTLNSALTQTICGNLKDLFTISLGWAIFGGLPFDLIVTGEASLNCEEDDQLCVAMRTPLKQSATGLDSLCEQATT
ncbi:UNVERIFIED_CONTAM: UDP-N-acetylglucosamine transporter UGNT1 [Sesamum radiatum]|uniref:UDP-N-acetylglucosamine transporter UGNT1 n=1 Tax=Sesamum radiatum TaxID=300843 RepID=A0AAW2TT60_SESRA